MNIMDVYVFNLGFHELLYFSWMEPFEKTVPDSNVAP